MNSRERMLAAINRQPVDRIPTDIWATGEVWGKLRAHFGEGVDIAAELHIDGFGGTGPAYAGPAMPAVGKGESVDFWGMRNRRVPHEGGAYDEQCFYPLAGAESIDDLRKYAWPKVAWFDYSGMRTQAAAAHKTHAVQCGYMAPFFFHNKLRAEVRHCIDALASNGTGYILAPCHNLQVVTPVENIIAMYDESWKYGKQA